jgi:hypothetical protein
MDTIAKAVTFLKDSVVFIMTELKQMERMNNFISTNILTYELAIQNLLDTIQRLSCPLYAPVVHQSTLSSILALVNGHVLSLQKLVTKMTKWNQNIQAGGFRKFRALVKDRPSEMSECLFSKLLEIKPLLTEICTIERATLGSGVRIANPLLRAAWVLSGSNQVNDSAISKNIIAENFFMLLKVESGGEIKKPHLYKTAIAKLTDAIDGCAAGEPDNLISISELNEYTIPADVKTFRQLLRKYMDSDSSERSISDETVPESPVAAPVSETSEQTIEVPVVFVPKKIDARSPVEIPQCSGYGSNWPSVKILEFKIPESTMQGLEFDFVEILCEAYDQGWGGTGHNNIRYQINDGDIQVGCFIDRNKNANNNYNICINHEKASSGDSVRMWFSCANWPGWSGRVEKINVHATFD